MFAEGIHLTTSMLLVYGPLAVALFILWSMPSGKRENILSLLVFFAVCAGLFYGFLSWPALIVILTFAAVCRFLRDRKGISFLLGSVVMVFIALALFAHVAPGFHNQKYIENLLISPEAVPFTSYLNFDKPLVALFLAAFMLTPGPATGKWHELGIAPVWVLTGLVTILALAGMSLGYLAFDPKLPGILPIWMIVNLLFTCMAEELLFRGFIQERIAQRLGDAPWASVIAIGSAALFFGLVHYKGGSAYVLLSTIAGVGYGYAYHRSGRIEAAILVHWLLNVLHMTLFTYPALAS